MPVIFQQDDTPPHFMINVWETLNIKFYWLLSWKMWSNYVAP